MKSIPEEKLRRTIAKMFAAFPPKNDWDLKFNVYVEALGRIPISFVEEACDYAIRGKLNGGRFLPNAGELVQLAEELQARTLRNKRPKFSWERNEQPVHNTPEQRFRIIHGFRELLADLRSGKPIDP